ncbi:MAG: RNA-binding protein [Denitrovibrio sp.]|nr:MAG: RNA-binding protein [Denitrovibrio sp.]
MKELVEFIARSLVDHPDSVNLTEVEGEKASIIELRVDQSDLGKVIGKQGRTAKAIRTILNASGIKSGKKVVLDIVE